VIRKIPVIRWRGGGLGVGAVEPAPEILGEGFRQDCIGTCRLQDDPKDMTARESAGQVLIQRVRHRENEHRLKPGRQMRLTRGREPA